MTFNRKKNKKQENIMKIIDLHIPVYGVIAIGIGILMI